MKNPRVKNEKVGSIRTSSIIYHLADDPVTISQFLKYNQYKMHFPYEYSVLKIQIFLLLTSSNGKVKPSRHISMQPPLSVISTAKRAGRNPGATYIWQYVLSQ